MTFTRGYGFGKLGLSITYTQRCMQTQHMQHLAAAAVGLFCRLSPGVPFAEPNKILDVDT